jgi:hypothetical protein
MYTGGEPAQRDPLEEDAAPARRYRPPERTLRRTVLSGFDRNRETELGAEAPRVDVRSDVRVEDAAVADDVLERDDGLGEERGVYLNPHPVAHPADDLERDSHTATAFTVSSSFSVAPAAPTATIAPPDTRIAASSAV